MVYFYLHILFPKVSLCCCRERPSLLTISEKVLLLLIIAYLYHYLRFRCPPGSLYRNLGTRLFLHFLGVLVQVYVSKLRSAAISQSCILD